MSSIQGNSSVLLARLTGVNINSAGSDNAVDIPFAKYIVRRVIFCNPSANLSLSPATVGVFTAAGGGGTAISAAAILTTLTGSTQYSDRTLAAAVLTTMFTAAQLFIRNVLAHGSAATIDIYIFGEVLP